MRHLAIKAVLYLNIKAKLKMLFIIAIVALFGQVECLGYHTRRSKPIALDSVVHDLLAQCNVFFAPRVLDHFNWETSTNCASTFPQRYYVCGSHWKPNQVGDVGPIFIYLGNEADVLLYLNNSGLIWENAPKFGALIVFAEHRYYGESQPICSKTSRTHSTMQYLTAEQAMADYSELVWEIKHKYNATAAPVIAFGGSYGGMLAAWMRMKYPSAIDGAIAASAPIFNFEGEDPPFDPVSFAKGVTFDASVEGGSAPSCISNARVGFKRMYEIGQSATGRTEVRQAMRLCAFVDFYSVENVSSFREWIAGAWDSMAMGNFPYKSGYILNGHGELPPYPVRVACDHLANPHMDDKQLMQGMALAAGVFYNYSGSLKCFDYNEGANEETEKVEDYWGYQYCTEMFMPFGKDGVNDMFWSEPMDSAVAKAACEQEWNVTPRPLWATVEWGGKKIGAASRIAFSNGLLDPWHGGGVLQDVGSDLHAIIIPEGAHHLDLMFSRPEDPKSVKMARLKELHLIASWIAAARAENDYQRGQGLGREGGVPRGGRVPTKGKMTGGLPRKIIKPEI